MKEKTVNHVVPVEESHRSGFKLSPLIRMREACNISKLGLSCLLTMLEQVAILELPTKQDRHNNTTVAAVYPSSVAVIAFTPYECSCGVVIKTLKVCVCVCVCAVLPLTD